LNAYVLGAAAHWLLVGIDLVCAAFTGRSVARILHRERRRRQRREAPWRHYVHSLEDFPELNAR
jgi:hypothetical protein